MLSENWQKSRRSNNNGACVEARIFGDNIEVRDSKNPGGPILSFNAKEWDAFVDGAKDGDFDLG